MTQEVFKLMRYFPGSFINGFGECILDKKTNLYFNANDCEDETDITCKLLEWCSRIMAKGIPYSSERKNKEYRQNLIDCLNKYLKTNFTEADMYIIYDRLGNRINPDLTLQFIDSGFSMEVLKEQSK